MLPGLGLPLAFNALEKRIETALQLCRLKSPVDAQINGLVSLCEELQRLLKVAFIGKLGGRSISVLKVDEVINQGLTSWLPISRLWH